MAERNKIKALYGPVNVYDASGNIVGQVEKDDTTNRWFIGHDMNAVWDQKVLGYGRFRSVLRL
ncbi:hypothetical protein KRR40_22690 [Niabella defluvii]|nr:hypothetical protein KRR40_22690 [Niabella sp. I65]